ncbi:MAG: hypothetical protein A2355_17405 [Spirochaetes bacterium RIFOXYB1_FULL_32_8]|nr:MAG: hypothetical protein A2355_17405 [Spirochaetes bacterium RIFOXYB1_FULL_32_8]HBI39274.1 hypothetical protein [Spirochaetia bacterium]
MSDSIGPVKSFTYSMFFKLFFIYCLGSFFFVASGYRPNIINPVFITSYLFNQTLLIILTNFIQFIWFFIFLNYALFFRTDFIYLSGGKRAYFFQLISPGLNIVVISVIIFFLFSEFVSPVLSYQVERVKGQSLLAVIMKRTADTYYEDKNYVDALSAFEGYMSLIKSDTKTRERIRKLRFLVVSESVSKEKNKVEIPDNIMNYIDLADYFYKIGDYFSAWYYYQFIGEFNPVDRRKAINQIENIKKILLYRNSLMNDSEKITFIDSKTAEIRNLYRNILDANNDFDHGDYLSAYYKYQKISASYPAIRDVSSARDKSLLILKNSYINLNDIRDSSFFPSRDNFVFFYKDNLLFKAKKMIKSIDTVQMRTNYFFYDLQIFRLENNQITEIFMSKYAQYKNNSLSLIAFSANNQNDIYYPVLTQMSVEVFEKLKSKLDRSVASYFSSVYERNKDFMIVKQLSDSDFKKLGILYNSLNTFTDYVENGTITFNFEMDLLYNLKYDNRDDTSFSMYNLLKLNNSYKNNLINNSGFSLNFISIGISQKISRIFIFLSVSLLLISVCFRYRVKEFKSIYYLLIPIAIVFIYLMFQCVMYYSNLFISTFSNIFTIFQLALFIIIVNIIVLFFVILYDSSTQV